MGKKKEKKESRELLLTARLLGSMIHATLPQPWMGEEITLVVVEIHNLLWSNFNEMSYRPDGWRLIKPVIKRKTVRQHVAISVSTSPGRNLSALVRIEHSIFKSASRVFFFFSALI